MKDSTRPVGPYILVAVVTVALVALAYVMFFVPKIKETHEIDAQTVTAKATNATLGNQVARIAQIKADLPSLTSKVSTFNQAVPQSVSQGDLYSDIQALADQSGVKITTLSPAAPTVAKAPPATADPSKSTIDPTATGLSKPAAAPAVLDSGILVQSAVTINIKGDNVDEMGKFIQLLNGSKRPLTVTALQIASTGPGNATANLVATTFMVTPLVAPAK